MRTKWTDRCIVTTAIVYRLACSYYSLLHAFFSSLQINEFLSLPSSGTTNQDHYVESVDANFTDYCSSSGLARELELSLVQVIAGGIVRGLHD